MKYSCATLGRMQLDEYVRVVPKIYGVHDKHRSIWDLWCHTLHHGAAVAERIRKRAPADKLFAEIADLALWLFTVVHRLSGRPGKRRIPFEPGADIVVRINCSCSDLLWHRYPALCHLCHVRRKAHGRQPRLLDPCDCPDLGWDHRDKETKRADLKLLRRFSKSTRNRKPKSIDDWQKMFGTIFCKKINALTPVEIGFHLLEELGEASDAMVRMYSYVERDFRAGEPNWRQARLEDQFADAFSWLFALVEKLNSLPLSKQEQRRKKNAAPPSDQHITLSEIIWRRYGSDRLKAFRCPKCNKATCSCPLVFVPATHQMEDLLRKFKHSL